MSVVIFAGPSLAGATDPALPAGFTLHPPARQGDVYRAAQMRPRAIGIVDGYFEGVPSVWHKEILWAMSRGIAVYGSASIGALRAAELHACGMIGVGDVFSAYRDGVLEADDEVALLHGPQETGFIALTEPLVNVRATCKAALAEGVIDDGEGEALIAAARGIFYKNRTWREIVRRAVDESGSEKRLSRFTAWLPGGRIDQKRLDALRMIERMRDDLGNLTVVESEFEPTFLWERAVAGWMRAERGAARSDDLDAAVLNELRLDPGRYRLLKDRALARMQLLSQAEEGGLVASRSELAAARRRHRMTHGLLRAADLDNWLKDQDLDRVEYDRLIDENAFAGSAAAGESAELHGSMIDLLRLDGAFGAAATRAKAKAAALATGEIGTRPAPRLPPVLLEWFFGKRLGQRVPEDLDAFIGGLGFASRKAFYGLLAEEYLYLNSEGTERPP